MLRFVCLAFLTFCVACSGPQQTEMTTRETSESGVEADGEGEAPTGEDVGVAEPDGEPDPGPAIVTVVEGAVPTAPLHEPPPPTGLAALSPTRVAGPPMVRTLAQRPTPVRSARLRRVSNRRNHITDVEAWFAANQLTNPAQPTRRPSTTPLGGPHPEYVAGQRLVTTISQPGLSLLLYRPRRAAPDGPLVAVVADDGDIRGFFDFREWRGPPNTRWEMLPEFAAVVDDVLYISHMHRTYSTATGGRNAYISAIELSTGAFIWRSAPLQANTRTFAVIGDVIVTGYGFTDEKDYLYALDRHTGRRLARARLESGPRFIIERQGRIYVRAYDRDYVYELTVRTR